MSKNNAIIDSVRGAAQAYLDGLFIGDVKGLRAVFHPQARLYSATEAKLVELDLDAYMDLVANRPSARDKGDQRQDEILSISVGSPTSAHVRVRNVYLPKRFVDDLTFVLADGQWRIIAKVWHFDI
ncbi:nuclear transport factor 2 family protein [Paracoccus sp. 11-3]|uniref:Nuclear transport factor 2 family protein n=1 Tax=Paracoccus amoyensis TaxID=2760093 RepID=A0A926GEH3_9RHOB|nr:nuclear transport factor 2 family protein [Paracoccus amoyensis]MBC9248571.1 nuclear transport factor 2 family protein [Paracoccus amoyensis]